MVRIPGPSWIEYRWISKTMPSESYFVVLTAYRFTLVCKAGPHDGPDPGLYGADLRPPRIQSRRHPKGLVGATARRT